MQLIPIRKKFIYPKLKRIDSDSGRTYSLEGSEPVPSVTTVLSATKDNPHLKDWEKRVGQEEAERVRSEAATVGTHMHNAIERLLLNRPLEVPRSWSAVKGYRMAYTLIETFFPHVQEAWGTEIPLLYPGRYAGTSDCIGVYKGAESIMDYKQANKMKRREWIDDYFVQLAAYAAAHNVAHGTSIRQGVVMMVAQDGQTQDFVTCGREFDGYVDKWMRRVEQFHKKEASGTAAG